MGGNGDAKKPPLWRTDLDSQIAEIHSYEDPEGRELFQVCRFRPDSSARERLGKVRPRYRDEQGLWRMGYPRGWQGVLYHQPEVLQALEAGDTVWIVEGEKDADALVWENYVATCNPGGARKFTTEHAEILARRSRSTFAVVADRDKEGYAHVARVRALLLAYGVSAQRIQILQPLEGKDVHDHLMAGHAVDELVPVGLDELPEPPPDLVPHGKQIAQALSRSSLGAFVDPATGKILPPEPREWLIEQLIPVGVNGLFVAPGGTGKGFVQLALALHIALGRHLGGAFRIPRGRGVLILSKEDDRAEIHRRLVWSLRALGTDLSEPLGLEVRQALEQIDVADITGITVHLDEDALIEAILDRCRGREVGWVCLDPLGRFGLADPAQELNKAQYAGAVHNALGRISSQTGAFVSVTHHVRKAQRQEVTGYDPLGSALLDDLARLSLSLREIRDDTELARYRLGRDQRWLALEARKANYSRPHRHPLVFQVTEHGAVKPFDVLEQMEKVELLGHERPAAYGLEPHTAWTQRQLARRLVEQEKGHAFAGDPSMSHKRRAAELMGLWLNHGAAAETHANVQGRSRSALWIFCGDDLTCAACRPHRDLAPTPELASADELPF